ncbi:ABC transporter ATPase [candidate division MSBL1 archaeon SCGC-AAA259E19]|uniref:ABC transporter ATPase n=1 Tax=candidate division MSBL1 archaeon SCGC-AAA259E19 TaxID=1698264 RepID=A0A133UIG6_9EURY|nr:ABC transporter ATPase [candidate division MSBL1 archaeon SCGC-AAA259E19]
MKSEEELKKLLNRIDGKGYGAYKKLKGSYEIGDYQLFVDHVQGDPYASPSRFRIRLTQLKAGFPVELFETETRKIALEDYLTRRFSDEAKRIAKGNRGSGKSGMIVVTDFGQAVLRRTSCEITGDYVEVTFVVGLPAGGRTPLSKIQGKEMIFDEITKIAENSLYFDNLEKDKVRKHVETVEDAEFIRSKLEEENLVAFLADGSILPRESGIGDKPMNEDDAVPFESPKSLEASFDTPNRGEIKGMGIPEGVTLIVGGGYHGKSTLLNAIARSVYNHIPGDGREFVVTDPDAVVIRAEDGRFVENCDISPFISNVPSGLDTSGFSTEDASGSTSQAANITEALEVGAQLLLIDEDTSATNLMIRDERMQGLVAKEEEPITPLIDRIGQLYEGRGVSSILVMGGSGDYFDVADNVIQMKNYLPKDVTDQAREIAEKYESKRKREGGEEFGDIKDRKPVPESIDPRKKSGKVKIRARGMDTIQFGYKNIDLSKIHQITERSQVRLIGDIIFYAAKNIFDGDTTIEEGMEKIEGLMREKGIHEFTPYNAGNYASPRKYEIAAALNRLRSLSCE